MTAKPGRPLCYHCDRPVAPEDADETFIPQGGARGGADVVVHRGRLRCGPVAAVRRTI
jgi:hypothetical protein